MSFQDDLEAVFVPDGTLEEQAAEWVTALEANLVPANGAITGATKTKVTYDAKGLVTAGADATTADVADSTDKRYVSDAQLAALHAQSHAITSTSDHTSSATSGQILQADANGLPVDASNTNAEVASAVTVAQSKGNANGIASLDASTKVAQDPASASTSAGANTIPKSNASGMIQATSIVAQGNATGSTTGQGLELCFTGGVGVIQAYDRSTPGYLPIGIDGSTVTISAVGGGDIIIDAGGTLTVDGASGVVLKVNGTTYAGVSSDGRFYAQCSVSNNAASVTNSAGGAVAEGLHIRCGATTPASNSDCVWLKFFPPSGLPLAYVGYNTASPYAAFYAASDARFKTKIKDSAVKALDAICGLRFRQYDHSATIANSGKANPLAKQPHQELGLVAQEVPAELSHIVATDQDGYLSIAPGGLTYHLAKAVQELEARVAALTARVAVLEVP
jgi:hypothetical protein